MENEDKIVSYLEFRFKKDGIVLGEELLVEAENLLTKYQYLQAKILNFRFQYLISDIEVYKEVDYFTHRTLCGLLEYFDEHFGIKSVIEGKIEENDTK